MALRPPFSTTIENAYEKCGWLAGRHFCSTGLNGYLNNILKSLKACISGTLLLGNHYHTVENCLYGIIRKLRSYNDSNLRQEIGDDQDAMIKLVYRYFHCG